MTRHAQKRALHAKRPSISGCRSSLRSTEHDRNRCWQVLCICGVVGALLGADDARRLAMATKFDARRRGLCCVAALAILLTVACTPPPTSSPASPSLLSLEIPDSAFGF